MNKLFAVSLMSALICSLSFAQETASVEEDVQAYQEANIKAAADLKDAAQDMVDKAMIVEPELDLKKTMKKMGRNFKALNKAKSVDEMKEITAELKKYSLQAEALGLPSSDEYQPSEEDQKDYKAGMEYMNSQIKTLEETLEKGDEEAAKKLVGEINDTRKEGHKRFDVK